MSNDLKKMDPNRRVKVYTMLEGVWDDQGTGYVEFSMLEPMDFPGIVVKSEDDSTKSILLQTKVSKDDIYVRQQDTLVVWNEPSETDPDGVDLAISFQEPEGCQEFWEELHEIQTNLAQNISEFGGEEIELPVPSINNLDAIVSLFDLLSPSQGRILAQSMISKGSFLSSLFTLFKTIENNTQQKTDFKKAFYVTRRLFSLNSRELIENICDNYFFDVIYILDQESENKTKHTDFAKEQVKFVEDMNFNDKVFEKKIYQTFRITYLRDVAFSKILDEQILSTMGTMVYTNCVQLVTHFFTSKLTESLFTKMQSPELSVEALSNCMKLLLELCNYSSQLEPRNRILFYKTLVTNGMFSVVNLSLACPDYEVRKSSTLILLNTIDFDVSILRSYILTEDKKQGSVFFKTIVMTFITEPHYVTKTLMYEVVRGFLDTLHIGPDDLTLNSMSDVNPKAEVEKQDVINIFYQEFAYAFFEPLFKEPPAEHTPIDTFLKSSLCDLLATFVDHFSPQTRLFILKHNILPKVFTLLGATEKNLLLGPIRVLRRCVSDPANKYINYIVENDLFAPVIKVFLDNGDKYNALNSAILDIFAYIGNAKSNCRPLVKYFVDNFYEKVKHVTYVQTFKNLLSLNDTVEYYSDEIKFINDPIREKNRKKFKEEEREQSWFDSEEDDSYQLTTNNLIEELKSSEKRKHNEEEEGPENSTNVQDSPRPKRLKYSNSGSF